MSLSGSIIIVLTGLFTPLWWTWFVSIFGNLIYRLMNTPSQPSQIISLLTILGPTCFAGSVVGLLIGLGSKPRPLRGWVIYLFFFFLSSIVVSFFSGMQSQLLELFASPGTIAFLAFSLLSPLYYFLRQRAEKRQMARYLTETISNNR